jgi:hypothetical protein
MKTQEQKDWREMNRLARLWVTGKATKEQILRHMELSKKLLGNGKPDTEFCSSLKKAISGT